MNTPHLAKYGIIYIIVFLVALTTYQQGFHDKFYNLTREQYKALGWWQILALIQDCFRLAGVAILGILYAQLKQQSEIAALEHQHALELAELRQQVKNQPALTT